MWSKFKTWWNAERVGRVEEGTSQDYCPTNGGAICYGLIWLLYPALLLLLLELGSK